MLKKLAALPLLALLLLTPSFALAHDGPNWKMVHSDTVKVGPYTLMVETDEWPVGALKATPYHIEAVGGIAGKTVKYKWMPDPGVDAKPMSGQLHTDPGVQDAWYLLRTGVPVPGQWHWEFEVDGPQGKAFGQGAPFVAGPPPAVPMWLGWLAGLFPVYGLTWFIVREGLRRRQAMRLDAGARA